jgi:hypothetical protein
MPAPRDKFWAKDFFEHWNRQLRGVPVAVAIVLLGALLTITGRFFGWPPNAPIYSALLLLAWAVVSALVASFQLYRRQAERISTLGAEVTKRDEEINLFRNQNRARVWAEPEVLPWPPPPETPDRTSARVNLRNGSTVGAVNVIFQAYVIQRDDAVPEPFDLVEWMSRAPAPIAIGPHQPKNLQFHPAGHLSADHCPRAKWLPAPISRGIDSVSGRHQTAV